MCIFFLEIFGLRGENLTTSPLLYSDLCAHKIMLHVMKTHFLKNLTDYCHSILK